VSVWWKTRRNANRSAVHSYSLGLYGRAYRSEFDTDRAFLGKSVGEEEEQLVIASGNSTRNDI
jgi:hypothetical protein